MGEKEVNKKRKRIGERKTERERERERERVKKEERERESQTRRITDKSRSSIPPTSIFFHLLSSHIQHTLFSHRVFSSPWHQYRLLCIRV